MLIFCKLLGWVHSASQAFGDSFRRKMSCVSCTPSLEACYAGSNQTKYRCCGFSASSCRNQDLGSGLLQGYRYVTEYVRLSKHPHMTHHVKLLPWLFQPWQHRTCSTVRQYSRDVKDNTRIGLEFRGFAVVPDGSFCLGVGFCASCSFLRFADRGNEVSSQGPARKHALTSLALTDSHPSNLLEPV